MSKKLHREYRDRRLTPDEAAADRDVRRKVQQEYPPSQDASRRQPSPLGELLQKSIRESGKTVEAISHESGVSAVLIARFLAGERDIHLTTVDKLARSLGVEVTVE